MRSGIEALVRGYAARRYGGVLTSEELDAVVATVAREAENFVFAAYDGVAANDPTFNGAKGAVVRWGSAAAWRRLRAEQCERLAMLIIGRVNGEVQKVLERRRTERRKKKTTRQLALCDVGGCELPRGSRGA